MKYLKAYLKDYKRDSILAPLFKMLEAMFDLLVPVVVAHIINVGIVNQDRGDILMCCGIPVFRRSTRKFPAFLFSLFSFLFPPLDFSLIYNKFLMPFRGFFYWKNFFDML